MKAYKFKIRRPSKAIVQKFEQWLDVCRELYNAALQERRDAWKLNKVSIFYYDQINQLPDIKKVRSDVAEVYGQVLQNVLNRVKRSFDKFFNRAKKGEKAGYPRFKSKSRYNSFTYTQHGFKLEDDKLTLSKIGKVRLHLSRPIEGKIKTCTIKKEVDGWFIIFSVEENQCRYIPKTNKSVGIDVGIENYATLSTGETISNPKFLIKAERRLKTAQRNVSRKKKGSNNRKKAVVLLRKQYQKIKRQRKDFFHKTSLNLIREYDQIAVENLRIQNMVKNHRLAKSISDAAWGTFILILTNKAEEAGRKVVKVDARHTSQICSGCGSIVVKPLAVRKHKCETCGLIIHRDHNAAINIKVRAVPLGMEMR